ncbi:hypothetical protein GWI33_011169 [Rhynchophorus ferrugineus]|uniref:Uncharacterized protein n=1 Tax=Rhynchophorus ferrugineus TaxID=354439 RepID=A0A834M8N6_RHYFE|nr:hypothetical protein GWI33_011169 [Rhynchophorus ferrugineus]
MYSSGLSYSRYRPIYDDGDRYSSHSGNRTSSDYSWLGSGNYRPMTKNYPSIGSVKPAEQPSKMTSSSDTSTRRPRYTRSSTHSVTQLLTDSCSSLLQKITTKVRGPSATVERQLPPSLSSSNLHHPNPLATSKSSTVVPNYGASKSRTEGTEKYLSVLDRIYGRKKESDRKGESSIGRSLSKSSTTANVFQLSEKAYPYVNNNSVVTREKTPYRNEHKVHPTIYKEPSYAYLDRDSTYRSRHRSNHSELRPRRSSKSHRVGKSEYNDRKSTSNASGTTNLKLSAVEIPINNDADLTPQKTIPVSNSTTVEEDEEVTPTPAVPDPIAEREAKRKEIQSLIMKYSALDEAYNKASNETAATSTAASAAAAESTSVAAVIAKKYYPETTRLAAVSTADRIPSFDQNKVMRDLFTNKSVGSAACSLGNIH